MIRVPVPLIVQKDRARAVICLVRLLLASWCPGTSPGTSQVTSQATSLLLVRRVVRWPSTLTRSFDHRSRQGLRYGLGFLLAVVVAATACVGHDEVAAQAQWAVDAPQWVLTGLGASPIR